MFTSSASFLRAWCEPRCRVCSLSHCPRRWRRDLLAPNGTAGSDGVSGGRSIWQRRSRRTPARPGDTIWMRGGVYRGTFTSNLTGTAATDHAAAVSQ
jgi:hypothetical protein